MSESQQAQETPLSQMTHVKSQSELSEASTDTTMSSDCDSSSSSLSSARRVGFGFIEIRDYERIAGDHPDTRVGVPLAIGWKFSEREAATVDEHEEDRIVSKATRRVTSADRRKILKEEFGVSDRELESAAKEAKRVKKLRLQSNRQKKFVAKSQSALTFWGNKIKDTLVPEPHFKDVLAASNQTKLVAACQ